MDQPEMQAGAKVNFLEAELFAGFSHLGEKDILVVKQLNAGDQEAHKKVSEIADSIAITIKRIATGQGPKEVIQLDDGEKPKAIQWPPGIGEILESIEVKISQVYLYVASEGAKDKRKVNVEYAIGIGISLTKEQKDKICKVPPFDLIQLEELFLKIWHTKNDAILQEMNIVDFEKELLALEEKQETPIPAAPENE